MLELLKRHIVCLLVSLFLGITPAFSQVQDASRNASDLNQLLLPFFPKNQIESAELAELTARFEAHIEYLTKLEKRKSNRKKFLAQLFYKTHEKFLSSYESTATLSETLKTGNFGCVSGTAVFAVILDYFGFEYTIRELSHHVYVRVREGGTLFILESTDPASGFLKDVSQITRLTQQYEERSRKNTFMRSVESQTSGIVEDGCINFDITLKELAGIQYYNQSIFKYREDDFVAALRFITTGLELYRSERTERMMEIVISAILRSQQISKELKKEYLSKYVTQVQAQKLSQ